MTRGHPYRATARCILLCAAALLPRAGAAEEENTSLRVALSLHDPRTGADTTPSDGVPVQLSIALTDEVTGRAPRGLDLFAWVRRRDPGNSSCTEAARAFRATRRIPTDAVDLNGILIVSLNRDASLGVVDPKLNLYTSNMIAAHTFDAMPIAMAIDRAGMRVLLVKKGTSTLSALDLPTGQVQGLDTPVDAPVSIAVGEDGTIWLGDTGGQLHRLSPAGALLETLTVGDGPVRITPREDPEDTRIGAFTASGGLLLADISTGRVLLRAQVGRSIADATFIGEQAALAQLADLPEVELRYADAPDNPVQIPVAIPFRRLASGPDGRVAVAYSPGESVVALIDVALGRVVQPVALTDATVSEVGFTDNAAYLLSHDGGFVGAIDTATVSLGKTATIRRVNLGARSTLPPDGADLLAPLFPAPMILAVEPENQTGWVIGEVASSVEMPPMDSTRLRGGVPHQVKVVDRSLHETDPGQFVTTWAFPAGPHELVLTTGIAGLSTCVPFDVQGDARTVRTVPLRLSAAADTGTLVAGREVTLRLDLTALDGSDIAVAELPLLIPSLRSGWRLQTVARRDADGHLAVTLRFPHAGPYAVQPLALPLGNATVSALVVEVAQP